MRWENVNFPQDRIAFSRSKVTDIHAMPMARQLRKVLWEHWARNGMPREGPVFTGRNCAPHTNVFTYREYKRIVRRLGLGWMTLRMFRNLAATAAMEKTGNIRVAQMLLGHRSVRTTEMYLGRGEEAKAQGVRALESFLDSACAQELGTKVGTNQGTRENAEDQKNTGTADRTII